MEQKQQSYDQTIMVLRKISAVFKFVWLRNTLNHIESKSDHQKILLLSQIIPQKISSFRPQVASVPSRPHKTISSTCYSPHFSISSPSIHNNVAFPTPLEYFLKQPRQAQPYTINRQPLPRSHYQQEFLCYGIVPTFSAKLNCAKAENSLPMGQSLSLCSKASTVYYRQFGEKKGKLINSWELDCRQDKLKSLGSSLMVFRDNKAIEKKEKKVNRYQKQSNKQKICTQIPTTTESVREPQLTKAVSSLQKKLQNQLRNVQSEQKKSYQRAQCILKATMKDTNLLKLEYSFRMHT